MFYQQSQAINEDTVRAFYHRYVNHLRVHNPEPPKALRQIILAIVRRCQVDSSAHLTMAAVYVLAVTWSALKAISAQHRSELLDRELQTIIPKLSTFSMPQSSVRTVKQALQLIYFAQKSALESAIMTIHNLSLIHI